ncbi:hypothetical protein BDA96_03G188800 [Sorghum bicolor]|uniref:Uncharacterized protein n=3 Tax=Sorghum bicolor TaxID=4558 RepID=A0A921RET2_SORBI|nr:hypothetical protein BDA96_03G188800 [Sorghum bicolor]OQU86938.1 hypothetical protein SORBI_3003G174850 [Sorghum bicolor]
MIKEGITMKKEGIAAYHTHLKEIFRTADSDDDDAFTFLIHADLSLHNEDSRRSLPPRRHHRYRPSSSAQRSRAERRMRGSARSTPPEPLEPWPPSPSLPCSHSPPSPNLNPTTRCVPPFLMTLPCGHLTLHSSPCDMPANLRS